MATHSWLHRLHTASTRHRTRYSGRKAPPRAQPRLQVLEDRVLPSTVTWTNPNGGDWDTASNWSTGAVPGAADYVVINLSGITITHSAAVADAINSLNSEANISISGGSLAMASTSTITGGLSISGGTLTGAGNLTVDGAFTWTGGTQSTPGLTVQGNAAIGGGTLDGTHLVTAGTNNTWTGTVHAGDGAIWEVPQSATLTAAQWGGNDTLANDLGNGVATLNNSGTITSQVASGNGTIIVTAFQNYGTVTVASGDFALGGGGTLNAGSSITGADGSASGTSAAAGRSRPRRASRAMW